MVGFAVTLGTSAHVHDRDWRPGFDCDCDGVRICAGDVVNQVRARGDRCTGDGRGPGVNGNQVPLRDQGLDDWSDASDLFVRSDLHGARSRRLRADVDDARAGPSQLRSAARSVADRNN